MENRPQMGFCTLVRTTMMALNRQKLDLQRVEILLRSTKISLDRPYLILLLTPLHEKCLQSDWLRAEVFQLNLKYLHVKITNLLQVVV